MAEKYCNLLLTTRTMRMFSEGIRQATVQRVEHTLGGKPVSWAWEFFPKGSTLGYDGTGKPILAEQNMAEVAAFI